MCVWGLPIFLRNVSAEEQPLVMSDIQTLTHQALADVAAADTPDALEALRVALLGKHGSITAQLKALGTLPADQRKAAGEAINRARDAIGEALSARKVELEGAALDARLATETIDVTLPGAAACIRSAAPWSGSPGSSPGSATSSQTAPRSRTTGTTSRR